MRLKRMSMGALVRSEAFWVLGAFVLRAAFAWKLGGRFYQADESGYTASARSLACWGVYGEEGAPHVGALGAPLFFSLFYRLSDGPRLARLAQAALSAATAWGVGWVTREATGSRRAGRFALALSAVYPFFVYYSGVLMSETLYVAAIVAGLGTLVASLGEKGCSDWRAAAAGFSFAVAGLTRTEGVPIAFVLLAALGALCSVGRYPWKSWALAVVCWALPLAGWAVRNKAVCGAYTLDLHGGMTLLHGTMLYDIDQQDTRFSKQAFEQTRHHRRGESLDEARRDRYYTGLALRYMRENPGTTLRHWIQKAVSFWRFYPRIDKEYPDDVRARPGMGASRRTLVLVSLLFEPALLLAGFSGMWLLRERWRAHFPFYWMILATFAIHVIVVSQMRYRLPVMPFFILFSAAWLDRMLPRGEKEALRE